MHHEEADGPVVAGNSGNAEGAKGPDSEAAARRQPKQDGVLGEERGANAKAFDIPKQVVVEAYRRVKANRGAAGVDGESLRQFEADRKNQLYKIWNRLSSGSYFPPPVRLVEIEKQGGGIRPLGIPTVADRVAQAVVKLVLEPGVDPQFHVDSYGYRPGKSAHLAVAQARRRYALRCNDRMGRRSSGTRGLRRGESSVPCWRISSSTTRWIAGYSASIPSCRSSGMRTM